MVLSTGLTLRRYYFPLGNSPAVSLTQDLPPELDADILLLGCGDARNVLFTCFVDPARKIDVTCCDIEPLIQARNVLLYSLLVDDKENLNVQLIWNIYYHWKLDARSVELLETQIQKLLVVSDSIDHWHGSVYGSSVRFCDKRSLSLVRSHWAGFQSQGLTVAEKAHRLSQMEAAIGAAKEGREKKVGNKTAWADIRATAPLDIEALMDVAAVSKQWWNSGTTLFSDVHALEARNLNPVFLYSPNQIPLMHYCLSPIVGFPLCTALIPISIRSVFHLKHKSSSSPEYLVECAKVHFTQCALAFRRALENKLVIRVFCGDALTFCRALRNCPRSMPASSKSTNLFCDNYTFSPLELHDGEYGSDENAAPLRFDVVDTSNLVDHLGSLNVTGIASSLLKFHAFSSLYTETFTQSSLADRLSGFFGVDDTYAVSLLFGLVLPDLFTNATDTFDSDLMIEWLMKKTLRNEAVTTLVRRRLRWKRLRGCQEFGDCPYVKVEAKGLAKLLIQTHDAMFNHENPALAGQPTMLTQVNPCYNRTSFALLLNLLKATVVTDWDECVKCIYEKCLYTDRMTPIEMDYTQDLLLNMHLLGVDNGTFPKPTAGDVSDAVLASILPLPANGNVPELLCVTVRVPREKLRVFTRRKFEEMGSPPLVVSFEGRSPSGNCDLRWFSRFSAVQITYGKWHEQTKEGIVYPFIEEDSSQLLGTSDLFLSVYVPTSMLLQSKRSVPRVKCRLVQTLANLNVFMEDLGQDLCFFCCEMTSKDIFITRYMPRMSALPVFVPVCGQKDKQTLAATTVRFTNYGSKIETLAQRFTLDCPAVEAELANPSSPVKIEFKSPLTAVASIGKSQKFKLKFPVPVSPFKHKFSIERKSSLIEVESPLFDPLLEDASSFLFPTFITENPCGAAVPVPWTSTRIGLNSLPPIDLDDLHAIAWLNAHVSLIYSERERHISELGGANALVLVVQPDVRTILKNNLFYIFMNYTGLKGQRANIFGLLLPDCGLQILILPSCLRLDLINRTVVLDSAVIPVTKTVLSDHRVVEFLRKIGEADYFSQVKVSEAENHAWKAMMPALVERCRMSWKHTPACEYIQAGEAPLPAALSDKDPVTQVPLVSPICACGIGKFPPKYYTKSQKKELPDLNYIINQYGTRAAISPIFVVPYVEDCYFKFT